MNEQRAQWAKELAEIRAEEEEHTEKHIFLYAVISLVMMAAAFKIHSILGIISFSITVQIYRYFKKYDCKVEKYGLDMKVFAIVAGVSLLFMIFMPIFIEGGLFAGIAQILYGIATLCAILNVAYICVYLYGVRK